MPRSEFKWMMVRSIRGGGARSFYTEKNHPSFFVREAITSGASNTLLETSRSSAMFTTVAGASTEAAFQLPEICFDDDFHVPPKSRRSSLLSGSQSFSEDAMKRIKKASLHSAKEASTTDSSPVVSFSPTIAVVEQSSLSSPVMSATLSTAPLNMKSLTEPCAVCMTEGVQLQRNMSRRPISVLATLSGPSSVCNTAISADMESKVATPSRSPLLRITKKLLSFGHRLTANTSASNKVVSSSDSGDKGSSILHATDAGSASHQLLIHPHKNGQGQSTSEAEESLGREEDLMLLPNKERKELLLQQELTTKDPNASQGSKPVAALRHSSCLVSAATPLSRNLSKISNTFNARSPAGPVSAPVDYSEVPLSSPQLTRIKPGNRRYSACSQILNRIPSTVHEHVPAAAPTSHNQKPAATAAARHRHPKAVRHASIGPLPSTARGRTVIRSLTAHNNSADANSSAVSSTFRPTAVPSSTVIVEGEGAGVACPLGVDGSNSPLGFSHAVLIINDGSDYDHNIDSLDPLHTNTSSAIMAPPPVSAVITPCGSSILTSTTGSATSSIMTM
ncbi:hypothetical protein CEUSTIGMA_g8843.t1 [Chlamydomonas eustigma]|uniref:Uncharacterized protein n=1 Tax=Chlamydomonas eustigma TaxID=1157962 RepID=A0A250XEC3_9CHLO|nr:hypothetical protein CEUSTIGMA_g8843.t1 [Chlamydomonas eustigma]|eukprot:GAX81413.1 hypothetical protein CEUSTIGMA_g8843.t1 [Chlamydomonas eustigma]